MITNSRAAERKQAQKQPSTAQNSDKQDATNDAKALDASGPSTLLQASGSSTTACSVFQPKLLKRSQHAKNLLNAATCTSSFASFPNGTNGVVLEESSTLAIDLRRDSDPPKPFNPTSPFQATEFAGSGFSFDFSSPIRAEGSVQKPRSPELIFGNLSGPVSISQIFQGRPEAKGATSLARNGTSSAKTSVEETADPLPVPDNVSTLFRSTKMILMLGEVL